MEYEGIEAKEFTPGKTFTFEPPKPRRATNRELMKWLAQGNGEMTVAETGCSSCYFVYEDCSKDSEVGDYRVRKWGDTEWHEATVGYMFGEAV